MSKLLSAEFSRLFHSAIFRMCMLFSAGFAIFLVVVRYIDVKQNAALYDEISISYRNVDGLLFTGALYLIFVLATFIGIFVGTEYSDGTIRNKLMVGHERRNIYLSKLIVCIAAGFMMIFAYMFFILLLGNLLVGGTTMSAGEIVFSIAETLMVMATMTAILLLISLSIQKKAAGSVACLLVTIVMMFASLLVYQKLAEPEYRVTVWYYDENTGEESPHEKEKNPNYLTGTKRVVYETLNDLIPFSQLYQIGMEDLNDMETGQTEENDLSHKEIIFIYDCLWILVTAGVGILIFKKMNLK